MPKYITVGDNQVREDVLVAGFWIAVTAAVFLIAVRSNPQPALGTGPG